MLFLFCFAEFMDAFMGSALFPAIDVLIKDLKIQSAEVTWAFAAYSATFAAFLLVSGRIADIYSASESPPRYRIYLESRTMIFGKLVLTMSLHFFFHHREQGRASLLALSSLAHFLSVVASFMTKSFSSSSVPLLVSSTFSLVGGHFIY